MVKGSKYIFLAAVLLFLVASGSSSITFTDPDNNADVNDPVSQVAYTVDNPASCNINVFVDYGSGTTQIDSKSHSGGATTYTSSLDTSKYGYGDDVAWSLASTDAGCAGDFSFHVNTYAEQTDMYPQNVNDEAIFVGDPSTVTFDGQIDALGSSNGKPGTFQFKVWGAVKSDTTINSGYDSVDVSPSGTFSAGTYDWSYNLALDDGTSITTSTYRFYVVSEASTVTFEDLDPDPGDDYDDKTPLLDAYIDSDYSGDVEFYQDGDLVHTGRHDGSGREHVSYTLSEQSFGEHTWEARFVADGDGSTASDSATYDIVRSASVSINSPSSGSTFSTGDSIDVEYDYDSNMDGTLTVYKDGSNVETIDVNKGDNTNGVTSISFSSPGTKSVTVEFTEGSTGSYSTSDSINVDINDDASSFSVNYQNPDNNAVLYEDTSTFQYEVSANSGTVGLWVDGSQVDSVNHGGGTQSYSYSYGPYSLGMSNWYVKYTGDDGTSVDGSTQSFEYRLPDFIQNSTIDYTGIGGSLSRQITLDLRGDNAISTYNAPSGVNTVSFDKNEWVLDGFSTPFSGTFEVGDGSGHTDQYDLDFDVGIGSVKSDPGTWDLSTQRLNRDIDVSNNANQSTYNLQCSSQGYQNPVSGTVDVSFFALTGDSFTHTCKWQGDYITESIGGFSIPQDRILLDENYTGVKEVSLTENQGVDWNNNLDIQSSISSPFKCNQSNNSVVSLLSGGSKTLSTGFNCDPGNEGVLTTGTSQKGSKTVVTANITGVEVFTNETKNIPIVRRILKSVLSSWDQRSPDSTSVFTNGTSYGATYNETPDYVEHITNTSYSTSSLSKGFWDLKLNYTVNRPPFPRNAVDNISSKIPEGALVNMSAEWKDRESSVDYAYIETNETGQYRNYSTMIVDTFQDAGVAGWSGDTPYFSRVESSDAYNGFGGELSVGSDVGVEVNKSVDLSGINNLDFRVASTNGGQGQDAGVRLYNDVGGLIGELRIVHEDSSGTGQSCSDGYVWEWSNDMVSSASDVEVYSGSVDCGGSVVNDVELSFNSTLDTVNVVVEGTSTVVDTDGFSDVGMQSVFTRYQQVNVMYDQYDRTTGLNPATDEFERADLIWGGGGVGNEYVCWRQWAVDTADKSNRTESSCFKVYREFDEQGTGIVDVATSILERYSSGQSGRDSIVVDSRADSNVSIGFDRVEELNVAGVLSDSIDVFASRISSIDVRSGVLEGYSSGQSGRDSIVVDSRADSNVSIGFDRVEELNVAGIFSSQLDVFSEPVEQINMIPTSDESKQVFTNFLQEITLFTQVDQESLPSTVDVRTFDQELNEQNRFQSNEELLVRFDASHTEGRSFLDTASITLVRPDGTRVVEDASMTEIGNISKGRTYEYNYSLDTSADSSGEWGVLVDVNDTNGDVDSTSSNFIFQVVSKSASQVEQQSVDIFSDVPFTRELSVSNPSSVDFNGALVNQSIPTDVVPGTVEIINPDGIELTVSENVSGGYFTYSVPDLNAGGTKQYALNYDVSGLSIQTDDFTEQGGEAGTQRIQFNMSTVGPTDFTELTHSFNLDSPNQVTGVELFVDGVERTLDPVYDFGLSDADSDAIEEQIGFTVPNVTDEVDYEVRVSRGDPLNVTQETIVTNLPVTQTKTISWRKGIRVVNSNDFSVDVSRKVRVPLRATSIQVDGEFETKVFDNQGAYVPLEYTLSGNSQRAVYITYETPSIDISEERINPEVYWVDKPTFQEVNVTFQNPYPNRVKESTTNVDVLEGSELVARFNGEVVDEERSVETTYRLGVDNISAESTKEVNVRYSVPVANSTSLGSQNISNGNMLEAYRIASRSPVSRQNVWYELSDTDFSCIQAQRAYTIEGNESLDFRCGSEVDGAGDDFSTVVELPVLQPNDNFRLAVEHRAYQPVVDDARRVAAVVGNNAAASGVVLVLLVLGYWVSSKSVNAKKLNELIERLG